MVLLAMMIRRRGRRSRTGGLVGHDDKEEGEEEQNWCTSWSW